MFYLLIVPCRGQPLLFPDLHRATHASSGEALRRRALQGRCRAHQRGKRVGRDRQETLPGHLETKISAGGEASERSLRACRTRCFPKTSPLLHETANTTGSPSTPEPNTDDANATQSKKTVPYRKPHTRPNNQETTERIVD